MTSQLRLTVTDQSWLIDDRAPMTKRFRLSPTVLNYGHRKIGSITIDLRWLTRNLRLLITSDPFPHWPSIRRHISRIFSGNFKKVVKEGMNPFLCQSCSSKSFIHSSCFQCRLEVLWKNAILIILWKYYRYLMYRALR